MRKLFSFFAMLLAFNHVIQAQPASSQAPLKADSFISASTDNTELIYKVNARDGRLYQVYLGPKLDNNESMNSLSGHIAYVTAGTDNLFEPAIRILHNDGNQSLELVYTNHSTEKIDDNITLTKILLRDPVYPVEVTLFIKTFAKEDVFEQWSEIVHKESNPVTLYNYASSMLHFDSPHYWLTQFHGDWAEEMRMQESELTAGIKVLDTKLGTRAHMYQTPVFFLSLNAKSSENEGELIAGTLGWSGNFRFLFEIDPKNSLRVISGINPYASEYPLQPDRIFKTPSFIFTYSGQGKGLASRNMHSWGRKYGVLGGTKPRLLLLNNWESTYFNFDQQKLTGILDDTKKMGLDLFLLDDGWFGNKYPRSNDKAGLGDWQETKTKLPDGIGYLVKAAKDRGIKFGIWIEPEMVNPKSELYDNHPDWILKLPNRPENYFRNQLVLDLTNPKVQEFVYNIVDNIITKNPGIAFFKWDCNSMILNAYSPYLKTEQTRLYVDYVNSLYSVLEKLRQKYPNIEMMACSGGGSRVDYGSLRYFNEFWASDNTDAFERVFIQWGYSYFFPSVAVCNHVTSWGKQSLKFRTDVAMMGKLGFDIPVSEFKENELRFCQDAVANFKRLSDVIFNGDLYRLISPYEENRAVLMYVKNDKSKAVLFGYTLNTRYGENLNRVKLQGLDPSRTYKITEINPPFEGSRKGTSENGKSYTGEYLMRIGINVGSATPLTSVVYELGE